MLAGQSTVTPKRDSRRMGGGPPRLAGVRRTQPLKWKTTMVDRAQNRDSECIVDVFYITVYML